MRCRGKFRPHSLGQAATPLPLSSCLLCGTRTVPSVPARPAGLDGGPVGQHCGAPQQQDADHNRASKSAAASAASAPTISLPAQRTRRPGCQCRGWRGSPCGSPGVVAEPRPRRKLALCCSFSFPRGRARRAPAPVVRDGGPTTQWGLCRRQNTRRDLRKKHVNGRQLIFFPGEDAGAIFSKSRPCRLD